MWCDYVCVCVFARVRKGVLDEGFSLLIPAPEEHVHRSADPWDVPGLWGASRRADTLQTKRRTQESGRRSSKGRAWLMSS